MSRRLHCLKLAILGLAEPYAWCFDYDTQKWSIERISFRERITYGLALLETAIRGHAYVLVEDDKHE